MSGSLLPCRLTPVLPQAGTALKLMGPFLVDLDPEMPTAPPRPSLRQRIFTRIMKGKDELSHEMHGARKTRLFADLTGTVLEIGPGTGVNFRYLPKSIEWIGLEPNPAMHPHLQKEAEAQGFPFRLIQQLDLPDASVDAVISTLVLCSVPGMADLLQQIRRVLKPGGRYLFLEHVADRKGTFRRLVQKTVPWTPWRYFSDGCNPGREIGAAIDNAGFQDVSYESYLQENATGIIMRINRPHICGRADK